MNKVVTLKDIFDNFCLKTYGYILTYESEGWFERKLLNFITNEKVWCKEEELPSVMRSLYWGYSSEDEVVPFIEYVLNYSGGTKYNEETKKWDKIPPEKVKWITKEYRANYDGTFFWTFEFNGKTYYNAQNYGSCSACDPFEDMDLQDFKNMFENWIEYDSLEELKNNISTYELDEWERSLVEEKEGEE